MIQKLVSTHKGSGHELPDVNHTSNVREPFGMPKLAFADAARLKLISEVGR
jgi:hypothetical protein